MGCVFAHVINPIIILNGSVGIGLHKLCLTQLGKLLGLNVSYPLKRVDVLTKEIVFSHLRPQYHPHRCLSFHHPKSQSVFSQSSSRWFSFESWTPRRHLSF
uniref:Uncharacterized protein n=1 Tax=Cacopsylla melanoneura TaxID=428564 RepID=A0A8D9AC46_9HEMI